MNVKTTSRLLIIAVWGSLLLAGIQSQSYAQSDQATTTLLDLHRKCEASFEGDGKLEIRESNYCSCYYGVMAGKYEDEHIQMEIDSENMSADDFAKKYSQFKLDVFNAKQTAVTLRSYGLCSALLYRED